MELESFDEKKLPYPFGFRNMGATCYFNSLIQSLLSCSSLTNVMTRNKDNPKYKENLVASVYIKLIDIIFDEHISENERRSVLMEMSPILWESIIRYLRSKGSHTHFGHGQEDSHESFKMLMECWENLEDVIRLFTHKDHVSIYCTNCKQWNNSQNEDANNKNSSNEILRFYELAKGLRSEIPAELEKLVKKDDRESGTIEGYLTRQITYIDFGYNCSCFHKDLYYLDNDNMVCMKDFPCACKCTNEKKAAAKNCQCTPDELKSNKGNCKDLCNCPCYCTNELADTNVCKYRCNSKLPKIKVVSMRIIPEILVIICPAKVNGKYYEDFPEYLSFRTKAGETKYRAVSQIIHAGVASGGHYWAHALRDFEGLRWYELNDSSYNLINEFKPNEGTYVVFYHKYD